MTTTFDMVKDIGWRRETFARITPRISNLQSDKQSGRTLKEKL